MPAPGSGISSTMQEIVRLLQEKCQSDRDANDRFFSQLTQKFDEFAEQLCERIEQRVRSPSYGNVPSMHDLTAFYIEGVTADGEITTNHPYGQCLHDAGYNTLAD